MHFLTMMALAAPSPGMCGASQGPPALWAWVGVGSRDRYGAMNAIMNALAGVHYSIRYLPLEDPENPQTLISVPSESLAIAEGIVRAFAYSSRRPHRAREARSVIHVTLQGYEGRVIETLEYLRRGGYEGFVLNQVDVFSLTEKAMACPGVEGPCLGECRCDFIKTVELGLPALREHSPLELAALIVHEASHVVGCYGDEQDAWMSERRLAAAVVRFVKAGEVENDGRYPSGGSDRPVDDVGSGPTPVEDFSPAFMIKPKRLMKAI